MIHSIPLRSITQGGDPDAQMVLDDDYIYLIGIWESSSLYRIPLKGGNPQKIAVTKYAGGGLGLIDPQLIGNWIVLADLPYQGILQGIPHQWKVWALNVKNFSERLIMGDNNDPENSITTYNFAAAGGNFYWTKGLLAPGFHDDVVISMLNLDDGKSRVLTRTKYNGWIWSQLAISEGRLVVQRDYDKSHGGGSDIFLFDPADGQPQALSTDGASILPHFSYPWVIWEASPVFQGTEKLYVKNLQTLESRSISLPETANTYLQMDGMRVYWTGFPDPIIFVDAIHILDIAKNAIYVLPGRENEAFDSVVIHGGMIAWIRDVDADTDHPFAYLEWTTIK